MDPWHFGADPDQDSTPDLTAFFSDFKDAKKLIFFLITYQQTYYLQS